MTKLNQIIAAEKGVKNRTNRAVTDLYHALQKPTLFTGLSRTYQPDAEDGEALPSESTPVQLRVDEVLDDVSKHLTELWDITATKDYNNTQATANLDVGGQILIQDVPVSYLLWLEKQLTDLHSVLSAIPTLDPSMVWDWDAEAGLWRTEPELKKRTSKEPQVLVKYEATDKHPAQTEVYYKDVPVGTWSRVNLSGAYPATRVKILVERVNKLLDNVKKAREQANMLDVEQESVGAAIFSYLLAD